MPVPELRQPGMFDIPRRMSEGPVPLSAQQRQIWLHAQLAGAPIYNEVIAIDRRGALSPALVERAFEEIVRRHEAWRTTFAMVDGVPMQAVHPPYDLSIPVIDLRHVPSDRRESECERIVRDHARRAFDLSAAPLFRPLILRLEDERWRIYVVMHHLIFDGITAASVLLPEFTAVYDAYAADQPSPLPEPSLQYPDFCEWQRHAIPDDVLRGHLDYWRTQLTDAPPLDLPTDRRRPAEPRFAASHVMSGIPFEVAEALRLIGRRRNATLYMTLMAALVVLLHRYEGHDDVVLGCATSARKHTALEGVLGCFANVLPLRTSIAGNPTFSDLLTRVQGTVLDALSHDDVSFDRIVHELSPRREEAFQSYFQVLYTLEQEPVLPAGWKAMTVQATAAKSDVHFRFLETGNALEASLVFDTDLFARETAQRMAGHLLTLLENVACRPEARVADLRILTPAERQTLVVEWNRTDNDYARDASIHALFERQAARTPAAVALTYDGHQVTYAELDARADSLAERLRGSGVVPGALVGVCLPRSVEMIVALVAILKAGGGYVALDSAYPDKRLAFVLGDAGVRVVIGGDDVAQRLRGTGVQCLGVDSRTGAVAKGASAAVSPEAVAYVTYTSGSTGEPKGVIVPHRGVVRLVNRPDYVTLTAEDVLLQFAPLSFDASTFEIWGALLNGARLAICPPGTPSLDELGEVIRRERVTTVWLTAPLFHQMAENNAHALAGVRQLLAGGDVLSPDHVRRALAERFGAVINGYGPTENTTFTCCYRMTDAAQVPSSSVPIGRPIANTRVYVLDRYRDPVPVGVPGELYIGGDGLARGYLNRPDLTSERFVPDPFTRQPGARLYKSGDRVRYQPDGTLEFLGRLDRQVKIRGFRIEPGEIEAALMASPSVKEAAVTAADTAAGHKRLEAYVVPAPGRHPTTASLRAHLASGLPDYMLPASFSFLDEIPRTASGKLDRGAVRAVRPAAGGADRGSLEAPASEVERALADIWRTVLGVTSLGPHDNFFEIGGDSLQAVRLFAEIRTRLGQSLALATLFRAPTLARMAALLDGRNPDDPAPSPLVAIQPHGTRPPFFCVHPLGGEVLCYAPLARQLGEDQPFYALRALEDEVEAKQPSIEQLSARYVDAIRRIAPHGPFLLGGFSLGAVIAFEMAQRLRAEGEEIDVLAVVDAVATRPGPTPAHRMIGNAVKSLPAWFLDDALHMGARELLARVWRKVLFEGWRTRERLRGRAGHPDAETPEPVMRRRFPGYRIPLVRALHGAYMRYTPQPYAGRITVFRSRAVPLWWNDDHEHAWERLAALGVDLHLVPGSHTRVLKEPSLSVLARQLRACLDAAIAARTTT